MPRRQRRPQLNRECIVNCVINSVLKNKKLNVCSLNSQSICNKMDEFRITFKDSKATIIIVSETWCNSKVSDSFLKLPGYKLIRHDRKGKRGGGLAIYIKENIKFTVIEKSDRNCKTEYVLLEIYLSDIKLLLFALYNPPRSDCVPIIEEKLSQYYLNYDDVLLTGDLNIDYLQHHGRQTNLIYALFQSFGLTNLVSSATHFSNSSSSAIDYMVSSKIDKLLVFNQIDLIEFSRHDVLFCSLDYDIVPENHAPRVARNYSRFDGNLLISELQSLDWVDFFCSVNPNEILELFYSNLNFIHDRIFPEKIISSSQNNNLWFNQVIKTAMIDRDLSYRAWKISRSSNDLLLFKTLRNRVRNLVRSAKQSYLINYLDPKLPTRILWHRLGTVGICKDKQNRLFHNPDIVNSYFIDSVPNVQINQHVVHQQDFAVEFQFSLIDETQVTSAFQRIKSNAVGLDLLPLKFLKIVLPFVLPQITHLFNFIILTSIFPDKWKTAKVIPLMKKAGNDSLNNLRPISILPCLSKAFEILMKDQILEYENRNRWLSPFQSGYRNFHSTSTAILKVTHDISSHLDKKEFGMLVLLDFSKAFDSLHHKLLSQKLKNLYGFSGKSVMLLESYLANRSQIVCINDALSTPMILHHGVPQGSILGPVLFTFFINDISNCIKYSKFHMYADDIQLYNFSCKNESSLLMGQINTDLASILAWSKSNGMFLNASKSFTLPLCRGQLPEIGQIFLGQDIVKQVNQVQNLGFTFDIKMSWVAHVNAMCGKITAALRSLRPSFFLPISTKLMLFKSLILPFFNYGDIILLMMSQESKNLLRKTLNMCVRFIYGLNSGDHVSHLHSTLLGCPFDKYYEFRSNLFMYRLTKNCEPAYLYDHLCSSSRTQVNRFIPHINRTSFFNASFFVRGISIWNSLPYGLRNSRNFESFRRELKIFYNS